jgi:hypothetical protein
MRFLLAIGIVLLASCLAYILFTPSNNSLQISNAKAELATVETSHQTIVAPIIERKKVQKKDIPAVQTAEQCDMAELTYKKSKLLEAKISSINNLYANYLVSNLQHTQKRYSQNELDLATIKHFSVDTLRKRNAAQFERDELNYMKDLLNPNILHIEKAGDFIRNNDFDAFFEAIDSGDIDINAQMFITSGLLALHDVTLGIYSSMNGKGHFEHYQKLKSMGAKLTQDEVSLQFPYITDERIFELFAAEIAEMDFTQRQQYDNPLVASVSFGSVAATKFFVGLGQKLAPDPIIGSAMDSLFVSLPYKESSDHFIAFEEKFQALKTAGYVPLFKSSVTSAKKKLRKTRLESLVLEMENQAQYEDSKHYIESVALDNDLDKAFKSIATISAQDKASIEQKIAQCTAVQTNKESLIPSKIQVNAIAKQLEDEKGFSNEQIISEMIARGPHYKELLHNGYYYKPLNKKRNTQHRKVIDEIMMSVLENKWPKVFNLFEQNNIKLQNSDMVNFLLMAALEQSIDHSHFELLLSHVEKVSTKAMTLVIKDNRYQDIFFSIFDINQKNSRNKNLFYTTFKLGKNLELSKKIIELGGDIDSDPGGYDVLSELMMKYNGSAQHAEALQFLKNISYSFDKLHINLMKHYHTTNLKKYNAITNIYPELKIAGPIDDIKP